ncbi:hypothetical protein L9G16_14250 [Shewanella sp. A25]|nr:hypothetical protein [Shewanella shenzhenensis]
MLTKLLLTLSVVAIAIFMLTKRHPEPRPITTASVALPPTCWRRFGMAGALLLLGLSLLSYSVWYWSDQHTVVTVTIVSPIEGHSGEYQVRKGDISATEMVTVDGIHIKFSSAERLEILKE